MLPKNLIGNHVSDEYIKPIFTVSTSDIPFLESFKKGNGYVATTSEEILLYKPEIYDIVVKLTPVNYRRITRKRSGNSYRIW